MSERERLPGRDDVRLPASRKPDFWLWGLLVCPFLWVGLLWACDHYSRAWLATYDPGLLDGLWEGLLLVEPVVGAAMIPIIWIALVLAGGSLRGRPVRALVVATGLWSLGIGYFTWQYRRSAIAYAEAADPKTSPERLAELTHYDGTQVGYRLSVLLAANPNSTPYVLRQVFDAKEARYELARNPRTPPDVLVKLLDSGERGRRGLTENPALPVSIRLELYRRRYDWHPLPSPPATIKGRAEGDAT